MSKVTKEGIRKGFQRFVNTPLLFKEAKVAFGHLAGLYAIYNSE